MSNEPEWVEWLKTIPNEHWERTEYMVYMRECQDKIARKMGLTPRDYRVMLNENEAKGRLI